MYNNVNLNLIHRYLSNECTPEEKRRIRRWMNENASNAQAVETLQKIWNVQPRKELESDIESAWKRLEGQLEEQESLSSSVESKNRTERFDIPSISDKRSTESVYIWGRVAAVILLAFLLSLFFIEFNSNPPATQTEMVMREVVTKRAHQAQLTFNDGTRVVLNAASQIRFPERFDSKIREVFLEGEAYFEVAHKSGTTFVVRTGDAKVSVLGTKFNVKARSEENEVEVAVAEGKVSVQSEGSGSANDVSEVILTKDQMSVVRRGQVPTPPESIEINNYLTWLRGDFVFDQALFSEVLREWERRFDVDFVVKDSSLLGVSFSGEFRNESLEEMLRLASESLEFKFQRKEQIITIRRAE